MKKRTKADNLIVPMDFGESEEHNGDAIAVFDDHEIKRTTGFNPSDFKTVTSKKLHDVICIVNDSVKLPVRKDKDGKNVTYRHEGMIVYRECEVAAMKGMSDGMLQTIHSVKDIFGGTVVIPEVVDPRRVNKNLDELPEYDNVNHRFKRNYNPKVVYSKDPIPPQFVKVGVGNETDPTEQELNSFYEVGGLLFEGPVGGELVQTERGDDDRWFR